MFKCAARHVVLLNGVEVWRGLGGVVSAVPWWVKHDVVWPQGHTLRLLIIFGVMHELVVDIVLEHREWLDLNIGEGQLMLTELREPFVEVVPRGVDGALSTIPIVSALFDVTPDVVALQIKVMQDSVPALALQDVIGERQQRRAGKGACDERHKLSVWSVGADVFESSVWLVLDV